jgi:hypothetical protein
MANTKDPYPLPANLSVPGAIYCTDATCSGSSISTGVAVPSTGNTATASTGRIDPPWVVAEGWQGFSGQSNFIEFGKTPYAQNENGGIRGHVIYASTRPFDDPQMLVQTQWEPLVPHVTMNLYQESFAADGVTPVLKLVDTTQTSSWDDWAQGFRSDGIPNMNCPGQGTATGGGNPDLFFYTIYNQPNYLNLYNSYFNGAALNPLPYNSQYKCYDGMHNWNQLQPAPYDGMYAFPSALGINPSTGKLNTTLTGGVGASATSDFTVADMPGTNCTICIPNPDSTDPWRYNTPMLPAGKYVVEVVLPPGYELVKEEDKNILIGDSFIAPATVQFGGAYGLGEIFIIPDQASIAAAQKYPGPGYNANNAQNPSQNLGTTPSNEAVPGFSPEPVWPCVGEARTVPDFISLFPESKEVSPFAGATRNLCDRKEVTLGTQMAATAKFYIFTSTHIASKFAGGITDDFTSEFDPFAPVFGEKFAPPNMPISVKDWAGNEISRVYSDQWGQFDGVTYSTWEVNPPNPTGYSPTMMVTCMNDKGPTLDWRQTIVNSSGQTVANPTYNQMVTDPLFNPLYSQFCYELPFMPGQTDYLDTPVVPTSAFVGAGYNNPDCAYPTLTPAVSEVDGDVGVGPYVSAPGKNITITALGDQAVNNYGYTGPSATTAPYNQKTVTRHYGFGARCTSPTAGSATCNTASSVTIGGIKATVVTWSDTQILATVPSGVPACAIQQQQQYGGPGSPSVTQASCGQLLITAGNGMQSIDSVTVTVGGKLPTVVPAGQTIQSVIDAAAPGDLIIVPAGTYKELLLVWKPVRLQGVGAASAIIDANTQPAGKLDPWRRSVNCLFGLSLNGQPISGANPYGAGYTCPTGPTGATGTPGPDGNSWAYFSGGPNFPAMAVDRIPLEGILGWDATVNGNLAEQLQEPSIMGAYEGAGITVLSKGVNIPAGSGDVFGSSAEAAFPAGTALLTASDCATGPSGANLYPSNFQCNPSSIDGLGITDSSQGGGGIFVHAWAHNLQIGNNRIFDNAGTLSGAMSIGQGEAPEAYLNSTALDTDPGSCLDGSGLPPSTQLPYCLNLNVNIHNNAITNNASTGDELYTGTPAGAGGVSICTGADYYHFNYNWVCGNLSTGDGGGVGHLGFSWGGDIEHNSFLFNQSTNPSIQSNGGGLIVMGAAPDGEISPAGIVVECGSVTDNDCVPGLSDGTGPGLVINANLFQGNAAEAGSGGAIRLQAVNGTDIARFPKNPQNWYSVQITNNIIVNNVAGWDGAGISLEDALVTNIINNTIASNDTTASSGVLFNTLGAPGSSSQSPAPTCQAQNGGTVSCPQPAGLVTMQNSPQLTSSFTTGSITCPAGHYAGGTATNGTCINISYPILYNNIFWQNRSFQIGVGALGTGTQNQQDVVNLYNASFTGGVGSLAASQTSSGACPTGSSYWDIGVRNDRGPTNHGSGYTLTPEWNVLTSGGYGGNNFSLSGNPFVHQYCNGSRVPPENGGLGYQVPPGVADAVVPNPVFSLTPNATVDEGNNWINISWGPLSTLNPVTSTGTSNTVFGNYVLAAALDTAGASIACGGAPPCGPPTEVIPTPTTDFFGNMRPDATHTSSFDPGAVEFGSTPLAALTPALASITPTTGITGAVVNTIPVVLAGTNLTGGTINITGAGAGVTLSGTPVVTATQIKANFAVAAHTPLGARNVTVTTANGTSNAVTFTVVNPPVPTLTLIAPAFGQRGLAVGVTLTGTGFVAGTTVTPGAGITLANLSVVDSSTIEVTFTIAANAALGNRNVTVTTPGGTSNPVTFAVVVTPPPTLAGITPDSGVRGTSVPVALGGTNLTGATAVTVSGTGVTVGTFTVDPTGSTLSATFTISATAATGARTVTVTTPGGTSNPVTFTVLGPTLTSISPASGIRSTTFVATLTGTELTGASAITISGTGVTASGITVLTSTTISANFTITAAAATGARNVTVTTPIGVTNTLTFTVYGGPTLTAIAPVSGVIGTNVPMTLTGTNLGGATTVNVSNPGITVGVLTVNGAGTSLTTTFIISATAATGAGTVSVTTPGGTSNTETFTVNPPAPALTSIAPTSGARGAVVPVTLTGTNLTGASAIAISGTGVTASGITVVSATSVTANFTITAGAALGSRNVTVTTSGGPSNTVTFTVTGATVALSAPTPALTTGTANTTTKTGNVTVSNTATGANAGPFTFTAAPAITKVGTAGGTFSIVAGGTCTSTTVLTPGTTCTIAVQYAPGTSTATATANVTVTGTGLATATQTGANFTAN